MLVLFETPAGYAVFKLMDENKLSKSENLYKDFETPEAASKILKLKYFHKFEDTTEALAATTAVVEGKISKSLKKTLKNCCSEVHEQLAVADAKLGSAIKDKLQLSCVNNTAIQELMRCIRMQMDSLVTGVAKREMTAMALGLAHSLSRYKLKFSPDKIDTMVVQAVCLLDDLDKELNNYIMRAREWYGWHFPELSKIVTDNIQYIKTMQVIGQKENAVNCDLSDILSEEIEEKVKEAAETSMGSEITSYDAEHMLYLCIEIIGLHQYRSQLCEYLKTRMMALAPNLTVLVGDLVGARLISKAGSLTNLAKHPASTLQILGAEKALFRALKSKKNTPKYGLIYHSQLVGQSSNKNKGKISRMLAAKASLAVRVDALGDTTSYDLGVDHKVKLEERLKLLESGNMRRISGTAKAKAKFEKYHSKNEFMQYSTSIDSTLPSKKRMIEEVNTQESEEPKQKKKKKHSMDNGQTEIKEKEVEEKTEPVVSKKKKKREHSMDNGQIEVKEEVETESVTPKKKKKKHSLEPKTDDTEESSRVQQEQAESNAVPKKKKKHSLKLETENSAEASGTQQEIIEPSATPKKKKKRSTEPKMEDVMESSGVQQEEAESNSVSKKKKKRSIQPKTEDTIEPSSAQQEETEPSVVSKKKKKHSMEPKTEDAGTSSGVQEAQAEVDSNLVSKKKKKKKKQESGET